MIKSSRINAFSRLRFCHEWYTRPGAARAPDSYGEEVALLTFGQASFLAALDAAVLVDVALRCFKIFVVKKRYVRSCV